MAEPPNPWDLVFTRMDRIETKVDQIGERVVPRDEFERYKVQQSKHHDELKASIKDLDKDLDEYRDKQDENKARWRLFWAGLALTPVVSGVVAWIAAGGIRP